MMNKEKKKKRLYFGWLALAVLATVLAAPALAQDEPNEPVLPEPNMPEEPQLPGTVEGTGTYFEVTDSNYLNITFESSEPVHLRLESVPEMIVMDINTAEGAASTQITLTGFPPSTTYYKYEDDYHNGVALTTDTSGSYTFTQDLSGPHLVFIQPNAGTIFIPSDTSVGTWDPVNRIYTLTTDVYETIQIDEDNLTLDGAGHKVNGPEWGYGIYLPNRTGVTIKNVNVQGAHIGIRLVNCSNNTLTDNNVSNNRYHGIWLYSSCNNTLTRNTANSNGRDYFCHGIYLYNSSGSTLAGNTASNNAGAGINLEYSSNSTLTGNTASSNSFLGIKLWYSGNSTLTGNTTYRNYRGIYLGYSSNSTVTGNSSLGSQDAGIALYYSNNSTLTDNNAYSNGLGIALWNSNNNTITGNFAWNNNGGIGLWNSVGNTLTDNTFNSNNNYLGIFLDYSSGNILTNNTVSNSLWGIFLDRAHDSQIYNNNFINNTTHAYVRSSIGTVFNLDKPTGGNYWSDWTSPDADSDGYVDEPYVFYGGQDNLPWAYRDGWLPNQPPVADAGDNIQIASTDQTYTVIQGTASDPDEDPLQYRWLEGEQVLLDWMAVDENCEAHLDLGILAYFSIGNHTLKLEVSDGRVTSSDEMILTVQNSPPEAQPAPSSQVVEIGIDDIMVVADVADFDGDTLSYEWLKNGEVLESGNVQTVQGGETVPIPDLNIATGDSRFPLGIHQIELRVSDSINPPVSAFVSVEVSDTTAPSLTPLPSVTILWPPDHELQPVTIAANAFDNGGGAIVLAVEVQSSEPPDTDGDGHTIPDYYIDSVDDETGLIELRLRSERQGNGDGRTYTITISATDESGNQSVASVEILAPHDRRKK